MVRVLKRDVIAAHTASIRHCGHSKDWHRALALLEEFVELRFRLDIIQCCAGIKSCGQALQWSQSLQLLSRALQTSLQRLEVAWAACAKACGTWWQALELVAANQLEHEFVESAVMRACTQDSRWPLALQLLSVSAVSAGSVAMYNAALAAVEDWTQAVQLMMEMQRGLLEADVVTYGAVMTSCQTSDQWQWVLQILDELQLLQVRKNSFIYNIAIKACDNSSGSLWESALLFCRELKEMNMDDLVTYNSSISACATASEWSQALALLSELPQRRLEENEVTYLVAMGSCGTVSQWERCLDVLRQCDRSAGVNLQHLNTAINACSSAVQWLFASELFSTARLKRMEDEDLALYEAFRLALYGWER
ncbi:unnamed protein product [Cladocopium goreaui]|uniref:Pentacotripeptide-repeat region of PRORP domain-containing protein n=1 Tax=Cladocopium goreaui TaxID=2562237 RepID=A0A9P1DHV3_9DINO|nr:unnamed protein product [Cladocopium goreaui]